MPRRRRSTEPVFSFDSFLDVVANLTGIIIRLMLVVMVGAHLQGGFGKGEDEANDESALVGTPLPRGDQEAESAKPVPLSEDPELARYQKELAELQKRLLMTTTALEETQNKSRMLETRHAELRRNHVATENAHSQRDKDLATNQADAANLENELTPLRERLDELRKVIRALEQKPPERRALRFHLPVSRPVAAGELMFECRNQRVTFTDLEALLDQVRESLPKRAEDLTSRWEVTELTSTVGSFRLRYTIARDRSSAVDQAFGGLPPSDKGGFAYGLTSWELIPQWPDRGEKFADAVAEGSRFRQIVDGADAEGVVFTFFVYPDSFDLYRQLRDYLYDRGFVVAGRPLPMEKPIMGSRNGTISRGQ